MTDPLGGLVAPLLGPLGYPFMLRGLLEALLLGAACGLVGIFVVQRNLTFFAHALSHTVFPALVLATVLRVDLALGALVGTVVTLALILGLQRQRGVGEDSAVGIVFIGLLALGVVLVGLFRVRSRDVGAALVGNILGVGEGDLLLGAGLLLGLGVAVGALYRPLLLASFDRLSARALGLPLGLLDLILLAMVASTAVVSVKVVGIILTVAVLVTPAAAARLWARRVPTIMLLSAALGALAGASGLYVAYYVPIAPAAIIVLVLSALFAVSVLFAPRGVLRGRLFASRAPTAA